MSDYLITEIGGTTEHPRAARAPRWSAAAGRATWSTLDAAAPAVGPSTEPADALFVMIGAEPRTEWLAGSVDRDERGFAPHRRAVAGLPLGDQRAGRLRGRRRAARLGEAGRLGGRRGRHRDPERARVPELAALQRVIAEDRAPVDPGAVVAHEPAALVHVAVAGRGRGSAPGTPRCPRRRTCRRRSTRARPGRPSAGCGSGSTPAGRVFGCQDRSTYAAVVQDEGAVPRPHQRLGGGRRPAVGAPGRSIRRTAARRPQGQGFAVFRSVVAMPPFLPTTQLDVRRIALAGGMTRQSERPGRVEV